RDELRLADAGLTDQAGQHTDAFSTRSVEGRHECAQLRCSANHREVRSPSLRALGGDRHEAVGGQGLRFALRSDGLDRLDLNAAHRHTGRLLPDKYVAGWSRLLEAGSRVHGITRDETLPGRRIAGDDLARMDARPVRERDAPAIPELAVQRGEGRLHLCGGPEGADCIVLVGAYETKDRHYGVADVLLDYAAVAFHAGAHLREVAVQDLAKGLRIHVLPKFGPAHEVGDENRGRLCAD